MKSLSKGSLIATAVGILFLSNTALAQNPPRTTDKHGKVKCLGANSCNSQSVQNRNQSQPWSELLRREGIHFYCKR
jgi:hypothetical protein